MVCANFVAKLVGFVSKDDHVHLLVEYLPKVVVSTPVNRLKGVSSRLLCKDQPDIRKRYWKAVL